MSQKLIVKNFKWVKDISKFDNLHNYLPFSPESTKIEK